MAVNDWRGKSLVVGDKVVFTRGSTVRWFAVGQITEFIDHFSDWDKRPALLVRIVEESGWNNSTARPSKILLRNATKVEP
jgi:hypothetical protein